MRDTCTSEKRYRGSSQYLVRGLATDRQVTISSANGCTRFFRPIWVDRIGVRAC
ncbi:MAG: hypothetical protein GY697_00950 [Desulfobacterales bacterium]|nr:hypothetical protein [Desulfobacterales bacterium]